MPDSSQLDLTFDVAPPRRRRRAAAPDVPSNPAFFGPGYDKAQDQERLSRHCLRVLEVLRAHAGSWFTYAELGEAAGVPVGSVRTRVSNLKRWKHPIETRTREDRFREVRLP